MQARPDNLLSFFLLLFPVLLVAAWAPLSIAISYVSGWHLLSKRFQAQAEPYGDTRRAGPFSYGVQLRFRVNYSGVIRMITAYDALYVSAVFPFRFGHPPLCIPWDEVRGRRAKLLWHRFVILTLGQQERVPVRISERMARKLGILERIPSNAQGSMIDYS
jgi:hypothetical protein